MRFALFYHSLRSDWNHGNAHFLRGLCRELLARGHELQVHEPATGWSAKNLIEDAGEDALKAYREVYPELGSQLYADPDGIDLDRLLEDRDVVLVHEWTDPGLVRRIGQHHARHGGYHLLFHDTHHRSISAPADIEALQLEHYDGVLAFGRVITEHYRERDWCPRAWTWHEAADISVFHPVPVSDIVGDLAWIGNWGDGERSDDLRRFLIEPACRLGLKTRVHGVRWPEEAQQELEDAGILYAGYLPNHRVPRVFAQHRMTVHVPRRYYRERLPGIPTIRMFEALACGIPLVSAPWSDSEGLFEPGRDFLLAEDGVAMEEQLRRLMTDPELRADLSANGREAIRRRHTIAHRVDELMVILAELGEEADSAKEAAA